MPKVLTVEANYSGGSLYRGGYADVWKGERRGQEVAVKVLRVYSNDALQGVVRVGSSLRATPRAFRADLRFTEILQGGRGMEVPPASECPTTNWSDGVGRSLRNGIEMDGTWGHQAVHQDTSKRRQDQACRTTVCDSTFFAMLTIRDPLVGGCR